MNDYSYVLSEATSYPSDLTSPRQKWVSFTKIKRKACKNESVVTKPYIRFITEGIRLHLANYPDADKSRFLLAEDSIYANSRCNYGDTKQINIINLHASIQYVR
jgi:hypothetical protein